MLNNLISISSARSAAVKFVVYLGGRALTLFDRMKSVQIVLISADGVEWEVARSACLAPAHVV